MLKEIIFVLIGLFFVDIVLSLFGIHEVPVGAKLGYSIAGLIYGFYVGISSKGNEHAN